MTQRRLAAFAVPLRHPRWARLCFDGQHWSLQGRASAAAELALERVDVVLETGGWRWLRLRASASGWQRLWPPQCHVGLRRSELASLWPLIGAALALHRGRAWLGQP